MAGAIPLLGGCVTTTNGVAEQSKPTPREAAESHYALGAQYYKNGNYDLARDRLKQSLQFDPDRALTWTTLALTYEALGNERLAEEAYESAVRVAPRDFQVLNTYAVYLCRENRYEDAAKYFDRAIRVPTNDYAEITLTNAGVCMAQKPDYDAAEAYFRQALERSRNYGEALLQLSLLKYRQEDYLSARAFLQRYMIDNEPSAALLALGWNIETRLGDERAADEYYAQLLEDFPDAPETRRIANSN
jgi:type IV pilus assembly protein PilF